MTTMNEPIVVRELSSQEISNQAKTGDVLPDGSVLLWREDMNRMGLDGLRRWLSEKVLEERSTISVASDTETIQFRSLDEML
jgi:hypothetical protein